MFNNILMTAAYLFHVKAIVKKVVFLAQTFRKSKTEIDSLLRKESTEIEIIDF